MVSPRDVTALLGRLESRQPQLRSMSCCQLVYAELRRVAARKLQSERAGHTLQPTALFTRSNPARRPTSGRLAETRHFFGVAAQVMRRILVDHARRRRASKRGDGLRYISIDEAKDVAVAKEMPILALDPALYRLEKVDAELAKIVELRAFGGFTIEEAAHVLSVSASTAKRDWRTAKAWLNRELGSKLDRERRAMAGGEGSFSGRCGTASRRARRLSGRGDR